VAEAATLPKSNVPRRSFGTFARSATGREAGSLLPHEVGQLRRRGMRGEEGLDPADVVVAVLERAVFEDRNLEGNRRLDAADHELAQGSQHTGDRDLAG